MAGKLRFCLGFPSSQMLRSVGWQMVCDVSGQPNGPIFTILGLLGPWKMGSTGSQETSGNQLPC